MSQLCLDFMCHLGIFGSASTGVTDHQHSCLPYQPRLEPIKVVRQECPISGAGFSSRTSGETLGNLEQLFVSECMRAISCCVCRIPLHTCSSPLVRLYDAIIPRYIRRAANTKSPLTKKTQSYCYQMSSYLSIAFCNEGFAEMFPVICLGQKHI
jgi:hypothetical protein